MTTVCGRSSMTLHEPNKPVLQRKIIGRKTCKRYVLCSAVYSPLDMGTFPQTQFYLKQVVGRGKRRGRPKICVFQEQHERLDTAVLDSTQDRTQCPEIVATTFPITWSSRDRCFNMMLHMFYLCCCVKVESLPIT